MFSLQALRGSPALPISAPCEKGKWKWKSLICVLMWKSLNCVTLCDPMDYKVNGILQARILEWVAFPFPRGSSQPRDQAQVSHVAGRFFTNLTLREAPNYWKRILSIWGTFTLCLYYHVGCRFQNNPKIQILLHHYQTPKQYLFSLSP